MGFFTRGTEPVPAPAPVPPGNTISDRLAVGANGALDKATEIYNKNPKLVGGLALVAGALLLNRMKRGRG